MEVAEANVLWVQNHYGIIVNWLKSQNPTTTASPTSTTQSSSSVSLTELNNFTAMMAIAAFTAFWTQRR